MLQRVSAWCSVLQCDAIVFKRLISTCHELILHELICVGISVAAASTAARRTTASDLDYQVHILICESVTFLWVRDIRVRDTHMTARRATASDLDSQVHILVSEYVPFISVRDIVSRHLCDCASDFGVRFGSSATHSHICVRDMHVSSWHNLLTLIWPYICHDGIWFELSSIKCTFFCVSEWHSNEFVTYDFVTFIRWSAASDWEYQVHILVCEFVTFLWVRDIQMSSWRMSSWLLYVGLLRRIWNIRYTFSYVSSWHSYEFVTFTWLRIGLRHQIWNMRNWFFYLSSCLANKFVTFQFVTF